MKISDQCSPRVCRSHLAWCGLLLVSGIGLLLLAGSASAQSWTLSWNDEFNGAANSAIDRTKWQFETGILKVNDEVEYYCSPDSSSSPCLRNTPNAYIDGKGHLVIRALEVGSSVVPYSASWTSARLNTANHLANFLYGRIESSMQLPVGPGLWPAFWALGTNIATVGWPDSGETDYMENVPAAGGLGPGVTKSTLHGPGYSGGEGLGQDYAFPGGGKVNTAFHTYGAIWSPNMIQFYVDDPSKVFFIRTPSDIPAGTAWPFNANFYLLLNLAVGGTGSWPGPPDNTTPNPALMVVDYIRAYTPSRVASPTMTGPSINLTAGQVGASRLGLNSTPGSGRVYLSCTTTAPKAACSIATPDPLNPHTLDFSTNAVGTANLTVTTTANTEGLPAIPKSDWKARSAGGEGDGGTVPGDYNITVKAYTVSNTSGTPDSVVAIPLKVN